MFIQYRYRINPVDRITEFPLCHAEHLTLVFNFSECRQSVRQDAGSIRYQHHRNGNILICLGKILDCRHIGVELIFIGHFDVLHELPAFSDIYIILHFCPAQPVQTDFDSTPCIPARELIAEILLPLLHEVS